MFGKFGEMGSADEINELAGNLLTEGDTVSIKTLAEENGIPVEYAEMYISGDIPVMCDAQTAAGTGEDPRRSGIRREHGRNEICPDDD